MFYSKQYGFLKSETEALVFMIYDKYLYSDRSKLIDWYCKINVVELVPGVPVIRYTYYINYYKDNEKHRMQHTFVKMDPTDVEYNTPIKDLVRRMPTPEFYDVSVYSRRMKYLYKHNTFEKIKNNPLKEVIQTEVKR